MKVACISIAAFLICAPAAAQTDDQCIYELGAMMSLDYEAFDTTLGQGWRIVGDRPGCEAVAADLLARYRTEKLDEQRRGLMHHEAQLRAASGQTEAAIALIEQVRAMQTDLEMIAYNDAEIAFLRNDLTALQAARSRLAAVPQPDYFAEAAARFHQRFPDQQPPTWPMNLDVVDGFIACFGRPYTEAYAVACRTSGS